MTNDRHAVDQIYRLLFSAFVTSAFRIVYPGKRLEPNWHVDAVCDRLQGMAEGRQPRRLVLNMPPRSLKTFIVSVCYPAWLLLRDPSLSIIVASYNDDFSRKPAREFRELTQSELMLRLSKGLLRNPRKSTENEFETHQSGGRYATSVGGTLTGRGADLLIIDDPLKADEAYSEAARRRVFEWFYSSAHSRRNRPGKAMMILAMQRLHMDDLAGHLIERAWPSLVFPAIAGERVQYDLGFGEMYTPEIGELLQPLWDSAEELESTRREIGTYLFTAQYLQNPLPAEGNMVKREWIKAYDDLPERDACSHVYITCDPAGKAGPTNDYTAIIAAAVVKREVFILEVIRGRWTCLEIKDRIGELAIRWRATQIIIETTGLGEAVRQELAREGRFDVSEYQPAKDKVTRASRQIGAFESGRVRVPKNADWLAEFLGELLGFPNARYDDQVDALTMLLEDFQERDYWESHTSNIVLVSNWRRNPFEIGGEED